MNNQYFILRHGETIHQTEKRDISYSPSQDTSLTERGKEQIRAAAKRLKKEGIDLIFSSDFFRTRQTARIVAEELGLKVNFDKRLRDINLGIYQGRKKEEFFKYFPKSEERFFRAPPKGESWADCQKRMLDFVREIDKGHQGKKILIISHGDPLWLLEGALSGLSPGGLFEAGQKKNFIGAGELRKLKVK